MLINACNNNGKSIALQAIDTLPIVINYALRFPAELRRNVTAANGFFQNWQTDFKLGDSFAIGPRHKEDNDGGEPPGYIPVTTNRIELILF